MERHIDPLPPRPRDALDYPRWDALPVTCRTQLAAVLTEMVGQYLQREESDDNESICRYLD